MQAAQIKGPALFLENHRGPSDPPRLGLANGVPYQGDLLAGILRAAAYNGGPPVTAPVPVSTNVNSKGNKVREGPPGGGG